MTAEEHHEYLCNILANLVDVLPCDELFDLASALGIRVEEFYYKGTNTDMKVYQAINKVQSALSKVGISKDRKNQQGVGYMFRGIDDVYNAVSPLLAEHGLCILPRVLSRSCEERQSKNGSALFYVTVESEFDFVSAEDGSKHTVKTFGEAMDSGDKATNKAMSAAYKYAAFQAFAIPTEGENDADAETHEVEPAGRPAFDVAKACAAITKAESRAVAEHYADVAFERATTDEERARIANALKNYEAAA